MLHGSTFGCVSGRLICCLKASGSEQSLSDYIHLLHCGKFDWWMDYLEEGVTSEGGVGCCAVLIAHVSVTDAEKY